MDAATLIAKALEQREEWVDLEPGKRVKVRRPAAAEMYRFRAGAGAEEFLRCAVNWDGFTEADILGAAVGASDAVPFNVDLWVTLALDNLVWLGKVADKLTTSIKEYLEKTTAAAGN